MADPAALRADLEDRVRTDRMVSPALVLLPLVILFVVVSLFALISITSAAVGEPAAGASAALLMVPVMLIYLAGFGFIVWIAYTLMWRRDAHLRRIFYLKQDAEAYLAERARETGTKASRALYRLRALERPLAEQAEARGAVTWAALSLSGFGGLGLLYLLMTDFRLHEITEAELVSALQEGLSAVGQPVNLSFAPHIPDRPFWPYLALTVVTLGIFGFYWLWVVAADPNRHFREHSLWEGGLEQAIA